jgi:chromosome segregation ATPase
MRRHEIPSFEELSAQAEPPRPAAAKPAPAKPAPAADIAWGPRLVQDEPGSAQEETADISELMAENLMLKARLKVETDRQEALQGALAEQIRGLRQHIAEEMEALEEMRAEQVAAQAEYEEFRTDREHMRRDRDALRADRDKAVAERDAMRAEREALVAEREMLREDRDLWRARAEALAQPLFQPGKR